MKKRPKPKLARPSAPTTASISTSLKTPIRFSANVVIPPGICGPIGRFLPAGSDSPVFDVSEVPPNLRPFIASSDEPDPESDDAPQLNYTLGTIYDVEREHRSKEFLGVSVQCASQSAHVDVGLRCQPSPVAAFPKLE